MGLITSVLPILYILAKPAVGYLMDYFTVKRDFDYFRFDFFVIKNFYFAEHSQGHIHFNNTHNDSKLCWILYHSNATGTQNTVSGKILFFLNQFVGSVPR